MGDSIPLTVLQIQPLIELIEGSFCILYNSDLDYTDSRVFRLCAGPISDEKLTNLLIGYKPRDNAKVLNWDNEGNCWTEGVYLNIPSSILGGQILVLPPNNAHHQGGIRGLIEVVELLLDPETGCPWDLEQTPKSLMKYLIEESYELNEAIESGDQNQIIEELGDVLLQPLMQAEIARRANQFDLQITSQKVADKLVNRHPHVFGEKQELSSEQVLKQWDQIKRNEKGSSSGSLLDGVPKSMPALLRALNISKRAARVGFEWADFESVFAKLHEEIKELEETVQSKNIEEQISELGDVLFTIVNVSRWLKIDPEEALKLMLIRFTKRFQLMEAKAAVPLGELSPKKWDMLWNEAKIELQR